jgi:hypothetical protein
VGGECSDANPCNEGFTIDCWRADSAGSPKKQCCVSPVDIKCALLARTEVRCFSRDRLPTGHGLWDKQHKNEFHLRTLGLLLKPSKSHIGCYEHVGFICAVAKFFLDAKTEEFTIV